MQVLVHLYKQSIIIIIFESIVPLENLKMTCLGKTMFLIGGFLQFNPVMCYLSMCT